MSWERTPDGHRWTYTSPGCGYVTTGDPRDILAHRLEHLARILQGGPTPAQYHEATARAIRPATVIAQAEAILRDDLERARKLWYPTIGRRGQ